MNKVILSGNIVNDIELKRTQNGEAVISNTIAVRRDYKNGDGNYTTDFINFVVWRQQAEYLNDYGKKGDRVELVGRWQVRKYTDNNNATRSVNEVVVESISVFSKTPKEEAPEQTPQKPMFGIDLEEDDLPF